MCCVLNKCTWDCITVCACDLWTRLRIKFPRTLSTGYQNPISIIITLYLACTSRYLYENYEWCVTVYVCTWATVRTTYSLIYINYLYVVYTISVATKYSKKYLVRVLSNYLKKVFSMSTLRGVFQKYLVRVLNTL